MPDFYKNKTLKLKPIGIQCTVHNTGTIYGRANAAVTSRFDMEPGFVQSHNVINCTIRRRKNG